MRKVITTCDVCGADIPPREDYLRGVEKSIEVYKIRTNIHITFDRSPDMPPDLCNPCFLRLTKKSASALIELVESKQREIEANRQ